MTEPVFNHIPPEVAIQMAESKWWEGKTNKEIVEFQLFTAELATDFSVFHEAVEKVLGRPVFTHEFARAGLLQKEFLGERDAPSFDEILALIPEDKRVLVVSEGGD